MLIKGSEFLKGNALNCVGTLDAGTPV